MNRAGAGSRLARVGIIAEKSRRDGVKKPIRNFSGQVFSQAPVKLRFFFFFFFRSGRKGGPGWGGIQWCPWAHRRDRILRVGEGGGGGAVGKGISERAVQKSFSFSVHEGSANTNKTGEFFTGQRLENKNPALGGPSLKQKPLWGGGGDSFQG